MPPWDTSLAQPLSPQDYNAGFRNFSVLGNQLAQIPQSYWAGQNQAYTQRMRDLFQNGVPTDPSQMAAATIQAGGGDYAAKLAPFMMQNELLGRALQPYSEQPNGGPSGQGLSGTGSAHLRGGSMPASAVDQSGVPPGASAGDVAYGGGSTSGSPAPTGTTSGGEGGGAEVYPGPQAGTPGAAPSDDNTTYTVPQAQIDSAVRGLVPAGVKNYEGYANWLINRGTALNTFSRNSGNGFIEHGQKILDAIKGASSPTGTMKDVASGAAAAKGITEQTVKQSGQTYNGIHAAALQWSGDQKHLNDLARSVLSNPAMYTGFGAERVLDWNRIKAVFGDTQGAALQEALQKVTAGSVLAQLNIQKDQMSEAGGAAGRIFQKQVELVSQASASLGTSLAGNRFLTEVQARAGQLAQKVDALAIQYKKDHKILDVGFDDTLSKFLQRPENQLFTQKELANPALLGSPSMPAEYEGNPAKMNKWAHDMGLQRGDAVRTSKGSYTHWTGGITVKQPQPAAAALPANSL